MMKKLDFTFKGHRTYLVFGIDKQKSFGIAGILFSWKHFHAFWISGKGFKFSFFTIEKQNN